MAVEPQRRGEGGEHLVRDADVPALLQVRAPGGAHPGEQRELLPAQPRRPAAAGVRQPHLVRCDALPAAAKEGPPAHRVGPAVAALMPTTTAPRDHGPHHNQGRTHHHRHGHSHGLGPGGNPQQGHRRHRCEQRDRPSHRARPGAARCGATVVLGARRGDRVEQLAAEIRESGGRAVGVPTDVRRRADLVRLVDTAVTRFGRLDVLVDNAGIRPVSPLEDLHVDAWDDMIDVNLRGVLHGIAAALPVFRRQEAGHFVTVVSTAAYRTGPGQAVYAATETAVRTVCAGLRQEVGDPASPSSPWGSSTPASPTRSPTPRPAPRCRPAATPWHWTPQRSRTPSPTPSPSRTRSTSTRSWYGPPRSVDGGQAVSSAQPAGADTGGDPRPPRSALYVRAPAPAPGCVREEVPKG